MPNKKTAPAEETVPEVDPQLTGMTLPVIEPILPKTGTDQAPPKFYLGSILLNSHEELLMVATNIANQLHDVMVKQGWYQPLERKDRKTNTTTISYHPRVEAWQCLAGMLGVTCAEESLASTVTPSGVEGWEAVIAVVRSDGYIIARGNGFCDFAEPFWKPQNNFALRAMAQTRGVARSMKNAFGYIMQLAGFSPTPLEEMPHDTGGVVVDTTPVPVVREEVPAADPEKVAKMWSLIDTYALSLGFSREAEDAIIGGILEEGEIPVPEDQVGLMLALWLAKNNGRNPTRTDVIAALKDDLSLYNLPSFV